MNTSETLTEKCVDGYELIPWSMAMFLVTSGSNLYAEMLLLDGVVTLNLETL